MKPLGVVLAGGYSQRMGRDKALIPWHGIPQYVYLARQLEPFCDAVVVSCRPEQGVELLQVPPIFDRWPGEGPLAGIVSCHRARPKHSIIVVACDMPFIEEAAIASLLLAASETSEAMIAVFCHPETNQLEPLCSLWQPEALQRASVAFEQGERSPRRFMASCHLQQVKPSSERWLVNINCTSNLPNSLEV